MPVPKERKPDRIAKLAKSLNFSVKTINGCRYFGPTSGNRAVPPKGSEIFVGRIPDDSYEDEIYNHFSKFGNIFRIKLTLNLDCSTKGYCFVKYHTDTDAKRAVDLGCSVAFRRNDCSKPRSFLHVEISTDSSILVVSCPKNILTSSKINKDINLYCDLIASFKITASPHLFELDFDENQDANVVLKKLAPIVEERWGIGTTIQWKYNPEVYLRELKKRSWESRKNSNGVPEIPALLSTYGRNASGVNGCADVNGVQNGATNIILPRGSQVIVNDFGQLSRFSNNHIPESAGAYLPVQLYVPQQQYSGYNGNLGLPTLPTTDVPDVAYPYRSNAKLPLYGEQSASADMRNDAQLVATAEEGNDAFTTKLLDSVPWAINAEAGLRPPMFGPRRRLPVFEKIAPSNNLPKTSPASSYTSDDNKPTNFVSPQFENHEKDNVCYYGGSKEEQAVSSSSGVLQRAEQQMAMVGASGIDQDCEGACSLDYFSAQQPEAYNDLSDNFNRYGIRSSAPLKPILPAGYKPTQFVSPQFENHENNNVCYYGGSKEEQAASSGVMQRAGQQMAMVGASGIDQGGEGACSLDYFCAKQASAYDYLTDDFKRYGISAIAPYKRAPRAGNKPTKFVSPQSENHEKDNVCYYGGSKEEQAASSGLLQHADQPMAMAGASGIDQDNKATNSSPESVIQKLSDELAKMSNSRRPEIVRDAGMIKRFFRNALTD